MAEAPKPRPPARAARVVLKTLIESGGTTTAADLVTATGLPYRSVMHAVSDTRRFVSRFGGLIRSVGFMPDTRYRLDGVDGAAVLAEAGPMTRVVPAPNVAGEQCWTPELDAVLLRMADTGSTSREISMAIGVKTRCSVLARLTRLRRGQTTEKGTPALGTDIVPRKPVGVTLPGVGGSYRYVNGALYRDGERQAGRGM